ncbi:MAG TPA: diguanylate cyclase [Desulfuromonadales bacterium]|nr:diguanylate cyclase [Desulfuromonadales bacterium]
MMPFRLTLVQKMILSFAMSGVCLMAALTYSITGMGVMQRIEQDIALTDIRSTTITLRLRELMAAQERITGRYRILQEAQYRTIYEQNADEFRREMAQLKKLYASPTMNDLEKQYRDYSAEVARLFGGVPSDPQRMKVIGEQILKHIDTMSAEQRVSLSNKLAVSEKLEAHTVTRSLGLAFGGVFCSFLIAAWMVYSFARSIGKLQHATHLIAAGNFDHDPQIPPGDEIGALSEDFRQMTIRLKELEQLSLDASPLTRLPGNIAIERVLNRNLREKITFAMCYLDLDNFKSYNDHYGYIKASEILKEVGRIIYDAVKQLDDPDAFVGHIGGDDFVVIINAEKAEAACQAVITAIDTVVPSYYSEEDRTTGAIEGVDRYGVQRTFPLISISIAALLCKPGDYAYASEIATAAAAVKDRVKESAGSNYVIIREAVRREA